MFRGSRCYSIGFPRRRYESNAASGAPDVTDWCDSTQTRTWKAHSGNLARRGQTVSSGKCATRAHKLPVLAILNVRQYTFLSELWYATSITLIKCSILCLYLRIFGIDRKFSILCYGMIAFALAWGIAVDLVTIFQCKPVQAGWDKTIAGEQCFNLKHFLIGTNVPNIIADAAIIVLPMPQIWKLHLSRMRKAGLVAIFLLAAL